MENVRTSLNGYRLDGELKNVPVSFVNALRRILLSEIPVVVLSNVKILDNTSNMTHEMLKHRIEMLPVNVKPEESAVIRDTKVSVRFMLSPDPREVLTSDFAVASPRGDILLKDRDLGTPLFFMALRQTSLSTQRQRWRLPRRECRTCACLPSRTTSTPT